MRDSLYSWLAITVASAVFFGACVGRIGTGEFRDWDLYVSGLYTLLGVYCVISHYKEARSANRSVDPTQMSASSASESAQCSVTK